MKRKIIVTISLIVIMTIIIMIIIIITMIIKNENMYKVEKNIIPFLEI